MMPPDPRRSWLKPIHVLCLVRTGRSGPGNAPLGLGLEPLFMPKEEAGQRDKGGDNHDA